MNVGNANIKKELFITFGGYVTKQRNTGVGFTS